MGRRIQGQNTPVTKNQLTEEEKYEFSMGNTIPLLDWFIDSMIVAKENDYWDKIYVQELVDKANRRESNYYGATDQHLYSCLDRNNIEGKSVAILGSVEPQYEAIVLSYGGKPTTIEYNKLSSNDERLNIMTVDEYNKNPIKFDVAFSISSFEHDGLGRYGDPIDPEGDFKAMKNVKENVLEVGGLLFLAVPVGIDKCVWNAHRIYGNKRWPKLIEGFEMVDESGLEGGNVFNYDTRQMCARQPVVVLKNKG